MLTYEKTYRTPSSYRTNPHNFNGTIDKPVVRKHMPDVGPNRLETTCKHLRAPFVPT